MSLTLSVRRAAWPIAGTFTISRGSKTVAETLIVTVEGQGARGQTVRGLGECTPYRRYGETLDSVEAQIEGARAAVEGGADRLALADLLPAGAARNAVDCALWDWQAKADGKRVWEIAGLPAPEPVNTVFTLSLDTVENMAAAAAKAAHYPALKLKLTGDGDLERVAAVREQAPGPTLVVDANEGWSPAHLERYVPALAQLGVAMIEQPLPAGEDAALADYDGPVTLCADESCHDRASLDALMGKYGMVNIKLDKTGGLSEALILRDEARARGFQVMVGCMLASSLAMAPAVLAAQGAEVVDLDGPLWLAEDYQPALAIEGASIAPPDAALWG
jgi:L-alanine-DL-glutamate epimerase-like enolase superfamily enzyme